MSSLLLAKILSTIFAVLGLSAIAERGGPTLAGILAGVPLGLAIIFFFIGIQQGPEFVAEAAPYALGGLAATLCLNLAYWRFSSLVLNYRFMTAVIAAISGFLIAAWAIAKLDLNALSGVALVAVCAVISVFAMRGVRATEIAARIPTTWIVVAMRAGLAVAVVLAVTEAAAVIGPQWSGLLAGFPVTLFPGADDRSFELLRRGHLFDPQKFSLWNSQSRDLCGLCAVFVSGVWSGSRVPRFDGCRIALASRPVCVQSAALRPPSRRLIFLAIRVR